MKRVVEASKKLDDGVHKGKIVDVKERTEPFAYVDVVIETAKGVQVIAGYPDIINPSSNLGQLLVRFRATLEIGKEVDVKETLIGKNVVFQTTTEEKNGKKFSKVLPMSVCPE